MFRKLVGGGKCDQAPARASYNALCTSKCDLAASATETPCGRLVIANLGKGIAKKGSILEHLERTSAAGLVFRRSPTGTWFQLRDPYAFLRSSVSSGIGLLSRLLRARRCWELAHTHTHTHLVGRDQPCGGGLRLDQRQRGGNRRYRPRSSLLGSQRKICDQNRADAWKRAIVLRPFVFAGVRKKLTRVTRSGKNAFLSS
jgi:hypothetical protein